MTDVEINMKLSGLNGFYNGYYLTVAVSLVILQPEDNFTFTRGISDDYPRSN